MAILFGLLQFTDFCIKFHLFLSQIHLKILFFFTTSDLIRIDSILFRMCLFHLLCLCVRYTSRSLSLTLALFSDQQLSLSQRIYSLMLMLSLSSTTNYICFFLVLIFSIFCQLICCCYCFEQVLPCAHQYICTCTYMYVCVKV